MITIEIDDRELIAGLSRLAQKIGNLRPVMALIGDVLRSEALESFERQQGPDGQAWEPLKMASIIARARRHAPKGYAKNRGRTVARFASGAKALLDTGQLRNSIQVSEVANDRVTVGTKLPYAAIHQFGGMAGRGRKIRIPARPFLGLSRKRRDDILDMIIRHIES